MNDKSEEGNYVWSDGSTVVYTNWNGREPNNWGGNEDCACMKGNGGQWNDLNCHNHLRFVCKIP